MSDMEKKEVVPDAVVKIEQIDPFSLSNNAIVSVADQDIFLQIIERAWLPEEVRSIALYANRKVDRELLEQLDDITKTSGASIGLLVRAVGSGLDLENVGRALVAINMLNEEGASLSLHSAIDWTKEAAPYGDPSLTEVKELNEKLAKNPKLAEKLNEYADIKLIMRLRVGAEESKHYASCGNIDEGVLNKFINQFRLNETYDNRGLETSEELSDFIEKVYEFAGKKSLNRALEKALKVAKNLSPDIQQDIHAVIDALDKEDLQRRDIRNAAESRDTGVRDNRDLSEETF